MLWPLSCRRCAVAVILSHRCCHPSRQLCSVGAIGPAAVIAAVFVVVMLGQGHASAVRPHSRRLLISTLLLVRFFLIRILYFIWPCDVSGWCFDAIGPAKATSGWRWRDSGLWKKQMGVGTE